MRRSTACSIARIAKTYGRPSRHVPRTNEIERVVGKKTGSKAKIGVAPSGDPAFSCDSEIRDMRPSLRTSTRRLASIALGLAMLRTPAPASAATYAAVGSMKDTEEMAHDAGVRAVIYGLPLVLMDLTMKQATNVARPSLAFAAPLNQFAHAREFPPATFKAVVRANVDTLYSSAFLDLSKEPMVLSVPDTGGRYYLMPMLDAWTNVLASPGKRTTGTRAGNFAITGPDWHGSLPADMTEVKSPTDLVWILGRTQTNGPDDYPAVRAIQNGYKLVPLSAFGRPYTPP
jgi:hypothetical protein